MWFYASLSDVVREILNYSVKLLITRWLLYDFPMKRDVL